VTEDGVVDFSTVTEEGEGEGDASEEDDTPAVEQKDEKNDDDADVNDEEENPEVEYMLESKLRKLYEASHEFGKDQLRIVLQTEPVHCELVSLLFVPYITRQAIHDAPSLRHSFRNMVREVEKRSIDENGQKTGFVHLVKEALKIFEEFVNSRAQYDRNDGSVTLESTVIAQVLIECDEVFSVTDVATGMLLQGNGEMQRVYHLVRLEVVVKERLTQGGGKTTFEVESWQIVDWDDLEDGNIWFI